MASENARDVVRAAVVAADRRRRARESSAIVWRVAPAIAAAALLIAVGHRLFGWPALLSPVVIITSAIALVIFVYAAQRPRVPNDRAAARLDRDAELAGELRSAHWFAQNGEATQWTDFHLSEAAARTRAIDWAAVYRPARQPRVWSATMVMALAALIVSATLPARSASSSGSAIGAGGASRAAKAAVGPQAAPLMLPPELQKKLEELLAGIENGKLTPTDALQRAGDLKDLLSLLAKQLDPELQKKLQDAAAQATSRGDKPVDASALAERARRDALDVSTPSELRDALEDLAKQLDKGAQTENAQAGAQSGSQKQGKGDISVQPPQSANGDAQDASMQFSRESAGAGASQASMVAMGLSSNDPNPGDGGRRGGGAPETPPELTQALRRETVEASKDTTGENITTETRRKTEQGHATASYTHAAAASFDRARSAAPPAVPELRRAQVRSYFIRKQ